MDDEILALLTELVRIDSVNPAEELVFRPELIVRGSTAKAPTPAS